METDVIGEQPEHYDVILELNSQGRIANYHTGFHDGEDESMLARVPSDEWERFNKLAGRQHEVEDGIVSYNPDLEPAEPDVQGAPDRDAFVDGLAEGFGCDAGKDLGLEIAKKIIRAIKVGSLAFVDLAQNTQDFQDGKILENADRFATWPEETGLECLRGVIVWDNGRLYQALDDIDAAEKMAKPSECPELWREIGDPNQQWPLWAQWLGAQDLYQTGDKVRSKDFGESDDPDIYKWVSECSDNEWRPGEFGWEKIGKWEPE